MTIKEVAQQAGVSHQAVYKKLKASGIKVETLKDKATGQLTPEGEKLIRELFSLDKPVAEDATKLSAEIQNLRNQVDNLEKRIAELTEERDFLRKTLSETTEALTNSQKLQAGILATLPPALPSGDRGRLRRAWDKIRGKDRHE